jgi:hypothetical protein
VCFEQHGTGDVEAKIDAMTNQSVVHCAIVVTCYCINASINIWYFYVCVKNNQEQSGV